MSKFTQCISKMEKAAEKECDKHVDEYERARTSPNTSWRVMEFRDRLRSRDAEIRDEKLAKLGKLRELAPAVDDGLITAAEAFKMVGLAGAIGDAAKQIARPSNERLHRESNARINATNRARKTAEQMFGIPHGALGRTIVDPDSKIRDPWEK